MINKEHIRLSKLSSEFNVGISTIIDFFKSQNIDIGTTPNTKIPIYYYKILLKEFSSDKNLKEKSNLERQKLYEEKIKSAGIVNILHLGVKKIIKASRSGNVLISKKIEEKFSEDYILESLYMRNEEVYFSKEFEEFLFKNIFLYKSINTIFHYSTLHSTFNILNTKNIRLTSIAGLNDRLEQESFKGKINMKNKYKTLNEKYLLSLTLNSLKDNLNMWRLYGDDGRGCMLGFEVDSEKTGFFIGQIIYNNNIINEIYKIEKLALKEGFHFFFNSLPYWKSFIKSNDYKYEKEVRLLYDNTKSISKQWYINSSNLINSYVQFNLQEIPLKLKEIWIGPCSFEPDTLKMQMVKMLNEDKTFNDNNIKVKTSHITHYRPTK